MLTHPLHALGRDAAGPPRPPSRSSRSSPSTSRTPTTCSRRSTGCCARALDVRRRPRHGPRRLPRAAPRADAASATATFNLDARARRACAEKLDELLDARARHARRASRRPAASATRSAASSTTCRSGSSEAIERLARLRVRGRRRGAATFEDLLERARRHPRARGVPAAATASSSTGPKALDYERRARAHARRWSG